MDYSIMLAIEDTVKESDFQEKQLDIQSIVLHQNSIMIEKFGQEFLKSPMMSPMVRGRRSSLKQEDNSFEA